MTARDASWFCQISTLRILAAFSRCWGNVPTNPHRQLHREKAQESSPTTNSGDAAEIADFCPPPRPKIPELRFRILWEGHCPRNCTEGCLSDRGAFILWLFASFGPKSRTPRFLEAGRKETKKDKA